MPTEWEFCKENPTDKAWSVSTPGAIGLRLFCFDRGTIYSLFTDAPDKAQRQTAVPRRAAVFLPRSISARRAPEFLHRLINIKERNPSPDVLPYRERVPLNIFLVGVLCAAQPPLL